MKPVAKPTVTPPQKVAAMPIAAPVPDAIATLKSIAAKSVLRCTIDRNIADELIRNSFVREVSLPSPYKSQRGKFISFLLITTAGTAFLKMKKQK